MVSMFSATGVSSGLIDLSIVSIRTNSCIDLKTDSITSIKKVREKVRGVVLNTKKHHHSGQSRG